MFVIGMPCSGCILGLCLFSKHIDCFLGVCVCYHDNNCLLIFVPCIAFLFQSQILSRAILTHLLIERGIAVMLGVTVTSSGHLIV